jgi:hypothetical protein
MIPEPVVEMKEQKMLLGRVHAVDLEGGDSGSILKRGACFPQVFFIRS